MSCVEKSGKYNSTKKFKIQVLAFRKGDGYVNSIIILKIYLTQVKVKKVQNNK